MKINKLIKEVIGNIEVSDVLTARDKELIKDAVKTTIWALKEKQAEIR